MSRSLRIAVADDDPNILSYFRDALGRLGHQVVTAARSGRELIAQCRTCRPELILTDVQMLDMDGIEAAACVYRDSPIPVILVSGFHDAKYIARAQENHVLAYLIKPIQDADLATAIAIAVSRFDEFQALRQETADLRQALADRKVIEQAKGVLMKQVGLDEQAAFQRLRKLSMDQNRKLIDVAHMVLAAEKAFTPPAKG
jgi:response regulator NasT